MRELYERVQNQLGYVPNWAQASPDPWWSSRAERGGADGYVQAVAKAAQNLRARGSLLPADVQVLDEVTGQEKLIGKGPAEKTGRKIDNTVNDVNDVAFRYRLDGWRHERAAGATDRSPARVIRGVEGQT